MDKFPRYSAVPWLDTQADLRPFGPAETTVEHGATVTLGFLVPDPFGRNTTAMVSIRTDDWRTGTVTLAITNVLTFDAEPAKKPMDMTLLRNPARKAFPDDTRSDEGD